MQGGTVTEQCDVIDTTKICQEIVCEEQGKTRPVAGGGWGTL